MTKFGTFDFSSIRFVPKEYYDLMQKGHIQTNDILIVKDGATTGKIAFVENDFPFTKAVVNEHIFLCRPNVDLVSPRFLFLWLWGPQGQSLIRSNFQGAAIGGINQKFVDDVDVPVPSLSIQKRIAVVLDKQMATVELARSAAEAQLEAAKTLPAAYLRAVFSGIEAQNWPRTNIGEITSLVVDGPHVTPSYLSKGIPFLTVRNIVNRKIDLSSVSYVSKSDHAEFSRRGKAEVGDILYTKDGTLGVPCVVEENIDFSFFVSVALIKLLKDKADPHFIAFALESPDALEQVDRLGAGAGLKHMVLKSIRALEVPIPPIHVQKAIATMLQEKISSSNRIRGLLEEKLKKINRLPPSLLRRAFNGEL
jgi:type I restriction enzyme S subunit